MVATAAQEQGQSCTRDPSIPAGRVVGERTLIITDAAAAGTMTK
jgi:hypothetical protein